ncbi:hypothetical protein HFP15_19845 [Amycolatopsis sp. K13G38]|uniref:Uncharacterized protein n=1 Tax=Amycolatopsis acididurans TaxID=2724524 RepID=A0ABX1J660_9PSEU|nr:hypothetical protein [Amycolatopsis acididurans]NKQ55139.1 hypothetical protein [Amycolatopsis acididurans]
MAAPELTPSGRLGELLDAWRADIASVPMPELVELAVAVAIVREGLRRTGAAPDATPVRQASESFGARKLSVCEATYDHS